MSGFRTASAADIINRAAKLLGVLAGQQLQAHEIADAMQALNDMLDSWSAERLMMYSVSSQTFDLTGVESYTIGIGQDFDMERPAFLVNSNPGYVTIEGQRHHLRLLSKQDYDRLKVNTGTLPDGIYYDAAMPYPTVYFAPVPASGTLTLNFLSPLQQFDAPAEEAAFPPGYRNAIIYNLAVALHPVFPTVPLAPEVVALADTYKKQIKRANKQPNSQRRLNSDWVRGIDVRPNDYPFWLTNADNS